MLITLKGVVIRERMVGEQDKFIDILTESHGIVEISARGARKITGKTAAVTQLFAYASFCIDERRDRYYLNSAEPIHIFYDIRKDLDRLSLGSYFAEMIGYAITSQHQHADILRLLLNTLHYLEQGTRSNAFLKALFELRFIAELGMMPDIIGCHACGAYAPAEVLFLIADGTFICKDCMTDAQSGEGMLIPGSVLQAVRHIVLADFDRLYHFKVSDAAQRSLSELAERYAVSHLERELQTLRFYKSLENLS